MTAVVSLTQNEKIDVFAARSINLSHNPLSSSPLPKQPRRQRRLHAREASQVFTSRLSPKSHIFMCTRLVLALLAEPASLPRAAPAEGTKHG